MGRPRASLVACRRHSAPEISRAVIGQTRGDIFLHVLGHGDARSASHLGDNRQASCVVGRFQRSGHAAGKPRSQLGSPVGKPGRRAIHGEHQLPPFSQGFVDRIQQLHLGRSLAGEELQVVDDQQIDAAVLAAEAGQTAATQRFEEAGRELLGRQVDRAGSGAVLASGGSDALQQVRLAHARRTVDHQGRHLPRTPHRHLGRRQRQPIAVPGSKRFEIRQSRTRSRRIGDSRGRRRSEQHHGVIAGRRGQGRPDWPLRDGWIARLGWMLDFR